MPKLFLIPTSLNPETPIPALLNEQLQQIAHLTNFIVETAKIGRIHLKGLNLTTPLQQLHIQELNKHKQDLSALIKPLIENQDLGIISDCGCPAVADPGSKIVALAHELKVEIIPLIGPSSILLGLMASGLNGQKFSFHGYLPTQPEQCKTQLKQLEHMIFKEGSTHIFIETPFRNQKLFATMLTTLHSEIRLCVAIDLMTKRQKIITNTIANWKKSRMEFNKQEIIFLIGS